MATHPPSPDLNVDLGELPGESLEFYSLAHRVNVACGGHAGDAGSMRLACEHAGRSGALVGAHPSYPDREHFGRSPIAIESAALRSSISGQCQALHEIAARAGVIVQHLKPHGALYHAADRDRGLADLLVETAHKVLGTVAILGPPDGELSRAAHRLGLSFLSEGFADRGYAAGHLIPRGTPGSVIDDPSAAAAQAVRLADSGRFQTICVHSDTPNALAVARAVRAALDGR